MKEYVEKLLRERGKFFISGCQRGLPYKQRPRMLLFVCVVCELSVIELQEPTYWHFFLWAACLVLNQTNQRNLLGNIRFTLQHIRISDAEWCRGCNTDIAHIPLRSAPLLWSDNIATSQRIMFCLRNTLKCVSCFAVSLWTVNVICSVTRHYWIPSTKYILIGFSNFVQYQ